MLMGGNSPEYEISLISGSEVVKNLNPKKYNAIPVIISKDGLTFRFKNKKHSLGQLPTINCQIFFIALHGPNGEDGRIQGFLDLFSLSYIGSGAIASAIGMDKLLSMQIFSQAGLTVPSHIVLKKGENQNKVWAKLSPPIFVKPRFQGSSVGTSKVKSKRDLKKALKLAFSYDKWAIVEEYLEGVEITCAIIGNDRPKALPLVEIAPKKEYFDYEAKYDPNLTDEIVPARINKELTKKAQQTALVAYQSIGCSGFGRVDMIITGNNVYVLEVNTIPGLSPVSLFPKAAKANGISYTQLLDKIIDFSINP